MHLNFSSSSSPLTTVSSSQFLHLPSLPCSLSSSLTLVSVMPASWVIGPESIPLRPLRKTSRGRGRKRKRRNKKQRKWGEKEEVRACIVESLGGGRARGKEVFLSRSTAAQSHIQYFSLRDTCPDPPIQESNIASNTTGLKVCI